MPKVTVSVPGGEAVEGEDIEFETTEKWADLRLSDGTHLRVKMVVASVVRLDGKYADDGTPIYVVKSTPALSVVSVPEHLRKKG